MTVASNPEALTPITGIPARPLQRILAVAQISGKVTEVIGSFCKPSSVSRRESVPQRHAARNLALLPTRLYRNREGPYCCAIMSSAIMPLECLVVSRHQPSIRALGAVLEELHIASEICSEPQHALDQMERRHFGAVVLDFDTRGAAQLLASARMTSTHQKSVIFAAISRCTATGSAFELGANFVLYKPLTGEQVGRALRAARGFMRPERRELARHRMEALAYISWDKESPSPALLIDVNERGVAIQAAGPISAAGPVQVRLLFPGTLIEAKGEITWADTQGRAGIQLLELAPRDRRELKNWVTTQSEKGRTVPANGHRTKARAMAAKQGGYR